MSFTGEQGGGQMRYPMRHCGQKLRECTPAMGILALCMGAKKNGRGQVMTWRYSIRQLTWLANAGAVATLNAGRCTSAGEHAQRFSHIVPMYAVFAAAIVLKSILSLAGNRISMEAHS